jgi:transcriptional antiterminator NusG
LRRPGDRVTVKRFMAYFVIQVRTGNEERCQLQAGKFLRPERERLFWPRRSLRIRRQGRWRDSVAPIFPGYLFLQTEELASELYWRLKGLPGFLRFLRDNHHIEPLAARDRELLQHFLSFGEVLDRSTVSFDQDRRIRVISGPLKTLEGRIVRVDRRKGRARVRLELYEDAFLIDFGFDAIESLPAEPPA